MGYVFDFNDARTYDAWFNQDRHRYCLNLEIKLLLDFLSVKKGQRILDIGCGTGISLEPLLDKGLSLTGIDPSLYMLDIASKKFKNKVDIHRGSAEDLPFDDNEFDSVFFFTSLEFTERPGKAIEEACRVAKDTIVICVLNKHAPLNLFRRVKGFFAPTIYNHAYFFSIWELKKILHAILGKVPVKWSTTLQFPFTHGKIAGCIEGFKIIQKSFFGTFIAMKIKPVPTFRTIPMPLKINRQKAYKPATGLATRMKP